MNVYLAGLDEMSDLLIEHGANINAQMKNGMTPLMIACHSVSILQVSLFCLAQLRISL